MAGKKEHGSKKAASRKSLFRQISKGDLVTIDYEAGEHRGHAVGRDCGNWVLVLERHKGTALATRENTVAVSRPKKLAQHPQGRRRLVHDDGRRFK
jgi:hypothetical protein